MTTFAWLLIAQQTFTIVACLNLQHAVAKDMASQLGQTPLLCPFMSPPHVPLVSYKLPGKSAKVKAH